MCEVSCILLSTSFESDSIGVQVEKKIEVEVPIIKIEDVYSTEFYEANQQGFKPCLRLKISALNYNGENELKYMDTVYSVIRTQEVSVDEIVLICERKSKNVK